MQMNISPADAKMILIPTISDLQPDTHFTVNQQGKFGLIFLNLKLLNLEKFYIKILASKMRNLRFRNICQICHGW